MKDWYLYTDTSESMDIYNQIYRVSILESDPYNKHCAKKASNHHANLPLEMYSFTL